MGVSGSGKSTVGAALAQRLRVPFADADDFHPPANIAKMTAVSRSDDETAIRARSDRAVARPALRRRRGDELFGAAAQVPRPVAPPLCDVEFMHLSGTPGGHRQRQAAGPDISCPHHFWHLSSPRSSRSSPMNAAVVIDVDQNIDHHRTLCRVICHAHTEQETDDFRIGSAITILAADPKLVEPVAGAWQLHPCGAAGYRVDRRADHCGEAASFSRIDFGAIAVGIVAGQKPGGCSRLVRQGFGDTAASVGILIALGRCSPKLLAGSGGADEIVDTIVGHASPRALPWAMGW